MMFRVSMARATSLLSMYPKQTTQVSTLPLASVSDCTLIVSIIMCYFFDPCMHSRTACMAYINYKPYCV